jgi:lysine 2,3-aminomutase
MGKPLLKTPDIATLRKVVPELFALDADACSGLDDWRRELAALLESFSSAARQRLAEAKPGQAVRAGCCAEILGTMFDPVSERRAGFSVVLALKDLVCGVEREDLTPAFFAELIHLFSGALGREGEYPAVIDGDHGATTLAGREAAIRRSRQLDELIERVAAFDSRYGNGLDPDSVERRRRRRRRIQEFFGATEEQWNDWRWQEEHVIQDIDTLRELVDLYPAEAAAVARARQHRLPFGVTPHYLSLMDEIEPAEKGNRRRDAIIRAQVLPPTEYVARVVAAQARTDYHVDLDFMREKDTSPIDLITRRYPAICIFKPFNTCPQICVYCQRNWEIADAMATDALASEEKIAAAINWIAEHPAIREVLITGGDPLALDDETLEGIVGRVAAIPTVERIRIGTRTLVTMPMRITERLAAFLGSLRRPGELEVAVVTHIEHTYELTPEVVAAVDRLRRQGIGVYNQLVFTFFVSRRFEVAKLRRTLRRIGIDSYYSFNTKGKEETAAYRVPIARLLQEQTEEARLAPGIERTDEAVFNVPGQGKTYIRSTRQRRVIGLAPNGSRIYEFLPWEEGIVRVAPPPYIARDVPVYDYLMRLEAIGEKVEDYASIWYYY